MSVQILEAPPNPAQAALLQPKISGERAMYKANNYLARHVSTCFGATEPVFLPLERLVWQVMVYFKTPNLGPLYLGFLDIDAETGEVTPFIEQEIIAMRSRASAFVKSYASSSTI